MAIILPLSVKIVLRVKYGAMHSGVTDNVEQWNKLDRVHDTHNRQKEPIGDLRSGQCVLEETGRVQEDTSPFVPDVANMRLELYKAPRLLPLLF